MLAVDLLRVCIAGAQPHGLPGAVNARYHLVSAGGRPRETRLCPSGSLNVTGTYAMLRKRGDLDTPAERRIRALRGI